MAECVDRVAEVTAENRKGPSGRSSGVYYTVEVRSSYVEPQMFGDLIIGQNWKELSVGQSSVGIPVAECWDSAVKHGLLPYETAQAVRWAFLSSILGGFCVETRLVAYDYEESYSSVRKCEEACQPRARRPWDDFENNKEPTS